MADFAIVHPPSKHWQHQACLLAPIAVDESEPIMPHSRDVELVQASQSHVAVRYVFHWLTVSCGQPCRMSESQRRIRIRSNQSIYSVPLVTAPNYCIFLQAAPIHNWPVIAHTWLYCAEQLKSAGFRVNITMSGSSDDDDECSKSNSTCYTKKYLISNIQY